MVKRIKKEDKMAIIYTYPVKATPAANDLILISDSADSNKTKQVKVSSLPSSGAGITLTTTGTSGAATLVGTVLNIPNYSTAPSLPLNGVQYRDDNGNFAAASSLIFEKNNGKLIVGDQANDIYGVIEIQSDNDVGAELKIQGGAGFYTTIRGSQVDAASYNITLPVAGPGGNNKILESDASGNLSWIDTPTGGGGVATFSNTNGTFVSAGIQNNNATGSVNMGKIDLSASGTADSTTFLRGDNQWATPIKGDVGFSPMSIYEGTDEVGSGIQSSAYTYLRQSVVENECTINSVDFFRLTGARDISIHVYEGTIVGGAPLVLSGTSSGGNINEINKLNFNRAGYTEHSFSAGQSVVTLVSFQYDGGPDFANALGNNALFSNVNLSRGSNVYYDTTIPISLADALDNLEDPTTFGVCLHFYKS